MEAPKSTYERLINLGEEWAELNAAASVLEETKKSQLARLANESKASSQSAKESEALCHPEYEEHIKRMVTRRKEANKAKVKYDSAKTFVELMRTREVSDRAANKHAT